MSTTLPPGSSTTSTRASSSTSVNAAATVISSARKCTRAVAGTTPSANTIWSPAARAISASASASCTPSRLRLTRRRNAATLPASTTTGALVGLAEASMNRGPRDALFSCAPEVAAVVNKRANAAHTQRIADLPEKFMAQDSA